ncbi:MAG TPA: hypothetical protein DCG75_17470 [Bacteroidales bacterium]|nr:hypothetical protein [Bacteroidales bacterium]
MFVINPDQYSLPAYRIGPFTTKDLSQNHSICNNPKKDIESLDNYCKKRFGEYNYTVNGREAIYLALKSYQLKKTDLVTILTTSQNFYISSCVTNEIEKFCKWNREIIPETKLIFVNHEFGYIYPEMEYISSLEIPIIEDCCTTFFSQDSKGKVGKYGDFAVYSFPKFFPIQIGGLLVKNTDITIIGNSIIDQDSKLYIQKVISFYLEKQEDLLVKRSEIYDYALKIFEKMGFTERFANNRLTIPSVLMLNNHKRIKDLPSLKTHFWNHGIQTSIFYGEDAFFLPIHQSLSKTDVDYFAFVVNNLIEKQ